MSDVPRATCAACQAELSDGALFCLKCGAPCTTDADPLIGKVIAERYLLRARLGEGGSGTIYLAEHVTVHKRVAVKILHHQLSRDDLAIERFRREATNVAGIDNEHIIEVHDLGRIEDGRLFLAMELLDGETLAAVLKRDGALPIDRAIDVLVQLGEALMEAHAMGYVHRDLRPGNVFLVRRRSGAELVKLLDFGLAKLVEPEGDVAGASLGMAFGDARYMSPEQAHGDPVDRRADIYSLGVMAFEVLTGKPPFAGRRVIDVLNQQIETPAPAPSSLRAEIPAWLDAIVLRAMSKRPDDRFVTVWRFIEALRQGAATGRIMGKTTAQSMPSIAPPAPAPRPKLEEPSAEPLAAVVVAAVPVVAAEIESEPDAAATIHSMPPLFGDESGRFAPVPPARHGLWIGLGALLLAGAAALAWVLWPRATLIATTTIPDARVAVVVATPPLDAGPTQIAVAAPPSPATSPPAAREPRLPRKTADARPASHTARPPVFDFRAPPDAGAAAAADRDDADEAEPAGPTAGEAPAPTPPNPSDAAQAEFFVKLGNKSLHDGDLDAAAGSFNRARSFDNGSADAIAGLGEIAMKRHAYAEAIVHFEAANRLAPRSARIHTLRGEAYLAANQKRPAAEAFAKALALDPGNAEATRGYHLSAVP